MKLHLFAAFAAALFAGVAYAGPGCGSSAAKKSGEGCAVKAAAAQPADAAAKVCCGKKDCKGAEACKPKDPAAAKCCGTCTKKAGDNAEVPAAEEPKPADAGEKKEEAPADKPADAPAAE